jgi:antitoxin MazE
VTTKVQKWGNSQGLRFPREIMEQAFIRVGEEVDISVKNGEILVKPTGRIRGKFTLKDLAARMPAKYTPVETNWGHPAGREVW